MEIPFDSRILKAFSTLINDVDDVIIITDRSGLILWVNSGFENLTKYTMNEVLGKSPGKLLQGPDTCKDSIKKMSDAIKNKQSLKLDVMNYTKYGDSYWIRLSIYPIFDRGDLIGYIGLEFNLTDKYNKLENMNKEQSKLENEITNKNKILSILSHDIMNLIQISNNVAELLLLENGINKNNIKYVKILQKNTDATYNLLSNMIKIYNTDNANIESIDLIKLINNAIENIQAKAELKNIKIYKNITECHILSNYSESLTIINNILSNAVKYTHNNSIIEIFTTEYSETIDINIKDYGIGIEEEMIKNILDGNNNKSIIGTNKEPGTGNGLKYVIDLLKKNNGKINIYSEVGKGTTIILTFIKGNK